MIGKLTGKVDSFYKNHLVVSVGKIGFKVAVPSPLLAKLKTGDPVEIFTHTYVREDLVALYGFETTEELALFERLLAIAGIGAKIALAVLSAGSLEEISKAVTTADVDFFLAIPGIGKKTAQRLIVDLRAVLGEEMKPDVLEISTPAYEETIKALLQFGFSTNESRKALRSIKDKSGLTTEQLLNEALKQLGKRI